MAWIIKPQLGWLELMRIWNLSYKQQSEMENITRITDKQRRYTTRLELH
jgi:hypothetical protein